MKKIFSLMATAALMAACAGNQGYTIKGTVENAADGDTVLLQKVDGRQLVALDTTFIKNGTFTFKGTQDTTANRYITCIPSGVERPKRINFFLENGQINISMTAENGNTAGGTPSNDIYQTINEKVNALREQLMDIYKTMGDTTLTDEQRAAKEAQIEDFNNQIETNISEAIHQNITNPVGIHLLKNNYDSMSTNELVELMPLIPAEFDNDSALQKIKETVANMQKTAEGQKFTDFTMQTPDGKDVKLSDYVGKNKLVLVDFWASWCGPCRREMPNLVEAYKTFKSKGLEIVGVSLDRSGEDWKKGIEMLKITWPQMSDLKYWQNEGAKIYAVSGIPHVMLIDAEGTIVSRGLHGEELQKKIAELLK